MLLFLESLLPVGAFLVELATLIFLILYVRGTFRPRINYRVVNFPSPDSPRFLPAIASLSNSLTTSGRITQIVHNIDEMQNARVEAISRAQRSVHFETFYMTPGDRADAFAEAIIDRAKSGVDVQLIVDSYGARTLDSNYWEALRSAGAKVFIFNPFNWKAPSTYAGRTHRKLLLIDGRYAYVGGAGVSHCWDGVPKTGNNPWFDVEFRLEGEIVSTLEGIFMQHWTFCGGVADYSLQLFDPKPEGDRAILLTPGDRPSYRSSSIRALFQTCIIAAKERIWISSPYFLPDPSSRELLIAAKNRGVDVRILTMGERTDKKFVHYASYELYGELLAANIDIQEYQPSMLHAKLILVDDCWVSSGSANFDPRSFFHNDELNFSTDEPGLVREVEGLFEEGFSQSRPVSATEWRKRSLLQRLIGRFITFFQWQL